MKRKPYVSVSLEIDRLSPKGFGVGTGKKTENSPPSKMVVPFTIPGDLVIAEVGPKKRGGYLGSLLQILKPSEDRQDAFCKHASTCGGCSLQHMKYERQLFYKQSLVEQLFKNNFKGVVSPIISSPSCVRYRNKMEYTFSQNKAGEKFLGLMKAGTKGRVENLQECHLCPEWFATVLDAVRTWWQNSDLLAFQGIRDIGSLRNLTLREGKKTNQKMVMLTVSGNPEYALKKDHLASFSSAVRSCLPLEGLSIFLRVQQAIRGQPTQFYEMNLEGPAHIEEELSIDYLDHQKNYLFKISPTAFFQPNTLQAEKLYSKALEIVGFKKRKLILDLYAGTSTLGMVFSPFAEKVISIELNPYAVFDGQSNAQLNKIENIEIYKGDVSQVLKTLKKESSSFNPDLVVLDPPRTGLMTEAVEVLLSIRPLEILYISCEPLNQARDCSFLIEGGYEIVSIQPVDQFPHTVHIENIVLLRLS